MDPNETLRRFWACIENENTVGARAAHAALKAWMDRDGTPPNWDSMSERDLFSNFSHRRGQCDSRQLLMPDAASFWDVFDAWTTDRKDVAKEWEAKFPFEDYEFSTGRRSMETVPITTYCQYSHGGYLSLDVRARPEVLDLVRGNMIAAGVNDRISWNMVMRKSQRGHRDYVLIIAHNSVIIGSRWIAIVDASTLPDFKGWPGGCGYSADDGGDVECRECGGRYWSGEGSGAQARCERCEVL